MSGKFVRVFFIIAIFTGLSSQSVAAPITSLNSGDLVQDANGVNWAYVGNFDLTDGPFWNDADDRCINATGQCTGLFADAINGVQAAELVFGTLPIGEYAISTIDTLVNRLAWYDVLNDATIQLGDSILADIGGDGLYSQQGDRSAYVRDRQQLELRTNFVFRSVPVNAPSMFAILFIAILSLGLKRTKY